MSQSPPLAVLDLVGPVDNRLRSRIHPALMPLFPPTSDEVNLAPQLSSHQPVVLAWVNQVRIKQLQAHGNRIYSCTQPHFACESLSSLKLAHRPTQALVRSEGDHKENDSGVDRYLHVPSDRSHVEFLRRAYQKDDLIALNNTHDYLHRAIGGIRRPNVSENVQQELIVALLMLAEGLRECNPAHQLTFSERKSDQFPPSSTSPPTLHTSSVASPLNDWTMRVLAEVDEMISSSPSNICGSTQDYDSSQTSPSSAPASSLGSGINPGPSSQQTQPNAMTESCNIRFLDSVPKVSGSSNAGDHPSNIGGGRALTYDLQEKYLLYAEVGPLPPTALIKTCPRCHVSSMPAHCQTTSSSSTSAITEGSSSSSSVPSPSCPFGLSDYVGGSSTYVMKRRLTKDLRARGWGIAGKAGPVLHQCMCTVANVQMPSDVIGGESLPPSVTPSTTTRAIDNADVSKGGGGIIQQNATIMYPSCGDVQYLGAPHHTIYGLPQQLLDQMSKNFELVPRLQDYPSRTTSSSTSSATFTSSSSIPLASINSHSLPQLRASRTAYIKFSQHINKGSGKGIHLFLSLADLFPANTSPLTSHIPSMPAFSTVLPYYPLLPPSLEHLYSPSNTSTSLSSLHRYCQSRPHIYTLLPQLQLLLHPQRPSTFSRPSSFPSLFPQATSISFPLWTERYSRALLDRVLLCFRTLAPGGTAVFYFPELVSPFALSLCYILYRSFNKFFACLPETLPVGTPGVIIVCIDFHEVVGTQLRKLLEPLEAYVIGADQGVATSNTSTTSQSGACPPSNVHDNKDQRTPLGKSNVTDMKAGHQASRVTRCIMTASLAGTWLVDPTIVLGEVGLSVAIERIVASSITQEAHFLCSSARFMLMAMNNRLKLSPRSRLFVSLTRTDSVHSNLVVDEREGHDMDDGAKELLDRYGIGADYILLPPSFSSDSAISGHASLLTGMSTSSLTQGMDPRLDRDRLPIAGLSFGDIVGYHASAQRALVRWGLSDQ